ncbi:glutathione peroxidase-like [Convolutriloba macropyga]|uniref:glutathione peroxidase-like n=1 Tax=Convolutriloba macropyga TaxID=536237 RepID=UPI003F5208C7
MTKDVGGIKNPKVEETIYQFTVLDLDGAEVKLSEYSGFLQEIYERYQERGLRILAFPSASFLQEPKKNDKIRDFVETFDVTYDVFAKVRVACCGRDALFTFLAQKLGRCRWNFTKYLIDKKGVPRMRFGLKRPPVDMIKDIERLLNESSRTT